MADFRRCILALAALVIIVGSVAPALAQTTPFACTATAAVPPSLRQEGMRELVGDIVLTCSGGPPAPTSGLIPQANFTIFTNDITSRILTAPNYTESLLLIDEPTTAQQQVCPTPLTGCSAAYPLSPGPTFAQCTGGSTSCYNVYQGIETAPNAITFLGIPIDPPITAGAVRVFRITNVRVNASALPVGPVSAFVSISGTTSVPVNNPVQYVGYVAPSLGWSWTPVNSAFLQCQTYSEYPLGKASWTEKFGTAFKIRDTITTTSGTQGAPGVIYNTESGLIQPSVATSTLYAGLADFGTRLKATFTELPHGITLAVPSYIYGSDGVGVAHLVSITYPGGDSVADPPAVVDTSAPSGGLPPAITSPADATLEGYVDVAPYYASTACVPTTASTCNNGWAVAVYEVVAENAFTLDTFTAEFFVEFVGTPGTPVGVPEQTNLAGTTAPALELSYAPTPNGGEAAGDFVATNVTSVIPAFVDETPISNIFTVSLCQTNLLFPYVVLLPEEPFGFDTGIAISNTSSDPYGTSPQQGSCVVNFYGGWPPAGTGTWTNTASSIGNSGVWNTTTSYPTAGLFGTGVIAAGQSWAFDLNGITTPSSTFPGFVGYAIATCNFQYAHGYAFISDLGLEHFAADYLALIIPDTTPRAAVPNICAALGVTCAPTGEQLVH